MFSLVVPRRPASPYNLVDTTLSDCPVWTNLNSLTRDLSNWAGHSRDPEPEIHNTDTEFRIRLDLQHFSPEEIKISSEIGRITIHAKHEEKQDNYGFIKREITRSYRLPEGLDEKSATSSMNSNGVLQIKIQKLALEAPKDVEIPVQFTSL